MFQRFHSIAWNTFTETIRQPIYGVLLLATTAMLILNVSLAAFTLSDDDKLLLDLGLSTLLLSGLFLSAFSATGVLSREIENKTVLTVISKPISRPLFFVGKFTGLLGALLLAFYVCFLVFVLAQRHGVLQRSSDPWDAPVLVFGFGSFLLSLLGGAFVNYLYGKHFSTTALAFLTPLLTASVIGVGFLDEYFKPIHLGENFVGGQVILAAYLVMLTVMITTAVALAASTRFGQVMTLLICTFVLGLGIASDYAFGDYSESVSMASLVYHVLPNIGVFWVIDGLQAESTETTVTLGYVGLATAYAVLVTAGIVNIGIVAFQRREVG